MILSLFLKDAKPGMKWEGFREKRTTIWYGNQMYEQNIRERETILL